MVGFQIPSVFKQDQKYELKGPEFKWQKSKKTAKIVLVVDNFQLQPSCVHQNMLKPSLVNLYSRHDIQF